MAERVLVCTAIRARSVLLRAETFDVLMRWRQSFFLEESETEISCTLLELAECRNC